MNKKSSTLIAALTISAIILSVVLLTNLNRPAEASMINVQSDFSLMTAGALGKDESVVIIDKAAQKLIVYTLENGHDLKVVTVTSFAEKAPAPAPK